MIDAILRGRGQDVSHPQKKTIRKKGGRVKGSRLLGKGREKVIRKDGVTGAAEDSLERRKKRPKERQGTLYQNTARNLVCPDHPCSWARKSRGAGKRSSGGLTWTPR